MPAIEFGPPDRPFNFVLFSPKYAPDHAKVVSCYDEVCTARAVEWAGEVRQVMFVQRQTSRDRIWRAERWIDITAEWFALHGRPEPTPAPEPDAGRHVDEDEVTETVNPLASVVDALSDSARLVLAALTVQPQPRKVLAPTTDRREWTHVAAELHIAGLMATVGTGRGTTYRITAAGELATAPK